MTTPVALMTGRSEGSAVAASVASSRSTSSAPASSRVLGLGPARHERRPQAADFLVEHLAHAAHAVGVGERLDGWQPQQVIDRRDDARP